MKAKRPSKRMAIVALLAAGALWLGWTAWRTHGTHRSTNVADVSETPDTANPDVNNATASRGPTRKGGGPPTGTNSGPTPRHMLRPPDPARVFLDLTPEQRVELARKGHGPGG